MVMYSSKHFTHANSFNSPVRKRYARFTDEKIEAKREVK